MNRYTKGGVALLLAFMATGCDDFLQGPGLTESPNSPTSGSAQQQLISLQASMSARLEGQLARNAGMYTQQIIGTNNQQLTYGTQYDFREGDVGQNFTGFYTGGGLVAMRNVQAFGAANDRLFEGIGKVWEALAFGTATQIWGDLPYSQANDPAFLTPKLDPQQEIYAAVQTRLDEGIAALAAAPSAGNCEPADVVFCASAGTRAQQIARWTAAARTLKARFHLHLVERNGNAAYTLALAQAQQGILEAPANATQAMHGQAPGDFRTFHGSTLDVDGNIWAEFLSARGGDIRAGHTLVQLLKDRNDPRLAAYFSPNTGGAFLGVSQNNVVVGTGAASEINIPVRRAMNFRQPIVTWAENQLIMAEANFRLGNTGAALNNVNAVRTAVGLPALGAVTYEEIMLEKYIAQFQNIDVWADYKRSCIPTLTRRTGSAEIPGRSPYSSTERVANPNIPTVNAYPAGTTGVAPLRNWNDPNPCH
ncbi:MAG: SusD/RagB family nutrient-binding outer membrane lipoprotein [Gemmatimonadaceae bacterium]